MEIGRRVGLRYCELEPKGQGVSVMNINEPVMVLLQNG
jgi:hypothetical protein